MTQQLKTKNINAVPGKLFCRQCKDKSLLETDSLYWWSRQISICYRYWQWNHRMSYTKEKAPINWHFTQLTRIYENFKELYFRSIQSTSWLFENSESDSYDKHDMKEIANDLVRLHKAMQKKLKRALYSEQIQTLTLVPDKWSRMYCSEYFNVFEYLVWTSHEIKKVGGILPKPAPKKRKNYHHWNTSSGNKRLWRWQFQ